MYWNIYLYIYIERETQRYRKKASKSDLRSFVALGLQELKGSILISAPARRNAQNFQHFNMFMYIYDHLHIMFEAYYK